MFKKLLMLVLCISTLLVGCGESPTEDDKYKDIVGMSKEMSPELVEYYSKLVPDSFKSVATDLTTKPTFDISTILKDDVEMTDDMYNAKMFFNDVTIMGTTLGDLYEAIESTGLVYRNHNLDFDVPPYHSVSLVIGTHDMSQVNTLGDDKLQGNIYAVNLSDKYIPAKDCVLSGYAVVCNNGTDVWGFDWEINDYFDDIREDGGSVYVDNKREFDYGFMFTNTEKSDTAKILFDVDNALDYLHENFAIHESSYSAKHTMQVGEKLYDLENLTFAQFIMDLELEDIDSAGFVPEIIVSSPFKIRDTALITETAGIAGLNDSPLFNGVIRIIAHAGLSEDVVNVFEKKVHSIETYTSDSKPGEFKLYGFVANDVEFITHNNLSEFAKYNNLELITEQWETSNTTEVKVDTGYGELRIKYKVSPSTTEQCTGFEWINLGLKKVK